VTVIYQKALRLSNDGQGRSTGEVVSLMSVDSTRLQEFCTYGLILISGTFQVVLAFASLYNLLGWSAFVGVAIMVCLTSTTPTATDPPVLDLFSTVERVHRQCSQESSVKTNEIEGQEDEDDVRVVEQHKEVRFFSSSHNLNLTHSGLSPYSIKLYAWDYAFMSRIMGVRNDEELKNLRSIGIVGVRCRDYPRINADG
jgi:ATP-binding cassette subfamily C (CFTR/MRP) protein 1